MAQGFLVSLGNAQLNGGDAIIGNRLTFNIATNLGNGSWTWSGTLANGNTATNLTANGTYYQGTDGSIYFVPNSGNVGTVSSAAANSTPTYAANIFGTSGNDGSINGNGDDNIIYGGSTTSQTGTGNDTINAGAGNDTVYGGDGNDLIRGGGNNDTLFGGDGNDTIYGDDQTAPVGSTETLNWTGQGTNTNVAGGFTQDTGNMRVTYAYNNDGAGTGAQTTTTTQYVTGTTAPNNSGLWLQGNGSGNTSTSSLSFDAEAGSNLSDEVINVTFRLNDIDSGNFQDIVTIRAYDANGNPVAVTLTPSGNDTVNGNTITAGAGGDSPSSANGSVLVWIAGPVHYIEIDYDNGLSNTQYLYVTNVSFTTVPAADGNDSIDGGAGDDTIYGGGGNDSITGGTGNDVIYGGTGNDSIQGNAGTDLIYGGAGDDTIDGGDDNDTVYGDAGNDILYGGNGADSLYGGDGNDLVYGGAGDDLIDGGNNDDTLFGGDGNDSILGGAGNDSLSGGAGDDTLIGGTGNDIMSGGDGQDLFIITEDAGTDTIIGGEGGVDNDRIQFQNTATTQAVNVVFTGSEAGTYGYAGGGATGTFTEIETILGTAYDDQINAAASNLGQTLFGGAGNDAITGGSAADSIYGGSGNDSINAGAGNDLVYGGAGNDSLFGGTGNDTLYGDDGNDVISGDAGNDVMFGGSGDDRFLLANGFGTDTIVGGETGETIGDTLDASAMSTATTVNLTGPEAGTLTDGANTATFSEIEIIRTGSGSDTITGGSGNETVYAGAGNDSFYGGGGNDLAFGGSGNDTLYGGTGNDTLYGDDGNDVISGDAGNDVMFGGSGDDTFLLANGFGTDTIVGGETGETIGDTLDASAMTTNTTVNFSGPEAGTLSDGTNTATFSEIEVIRTGSGNDTITGGSGNETIYAGAGNDVIYGGAGNDLIYGGDGNDTITGGIGADSLYGGAGNDTITFAEGDVVYGGDGDDTFILANYGEPTNGTITIVGGNGGQTTGDTLQLGKLADIKTLVITSSGPNGQSGSVTLDDGTILNFSEIENIICFTPGTRIATPQGARPIETLRVGDMVVTRDHGLQPIRWIQSRRVPAVGRFAPVRIRPGVVTGLDTDLVVSPQHRMLFKGYRAELLFGESEVLVSARHLIDGKAVTQVEGGEVTYIHMLFDEHEIVYAEGAATESFHPGDVGLSAVADAAREELFSLFPQLRSMPRSYGRAARRVLKAHEAELLR